MDQMNDFWLLSGVTSWKVNLSSTTHLSLAVLIDCYFNPSFSLNGINQLVYLETNDWLIKRGSRDAMIYGKTKEVGKANKLKKLK